MITARPSLRDAPVRETARRIAEREVAPLAAELDREHRFPLELVRVFGDAGLLSLKVPSELGGGGGEIGDVAAVAEELAYADVSSTMIFTLQSTCVELLTRFGEAPAARRVLERVVDGALLALALTEPEAGSDAGSLRTRARRRGDEFVIDGQKVYITNAAFADVLLVFVQTLEPGDRRGIAIALVEANSEGLQVGPPEAKMGLNASATSAVHLDGVRVPAERVLGGDGTAYRALLEALDQGRVGIASVALGLAQSALDRSVAQADLRRQFGRSIGSFQGIQFMLADMAMKVASARALVGEAVAAFGDPAEFAQAAAVAKCVATDAAMSVTTDAVQIHGGGGYLAELGVERLMRDAKILQIFEGTNQIMRSIVARGLAAHCPNARRTTKGGM